MVIRFQKWPLPILFLIVLFIMCVALYPAEVTMAPPFKVKAVDSSERPLTRLDVTEYWEDYSLEQYGRAESLRTDENGCVQFPARTLKASVRSSVAGCIRSFGKYGVHASCGSHYDITAGNETDGTAVMELRRTYRSEEHTSELQSRENLVCRLLLEKKKLNKKKKKIIFIIIIIIIISFIIIIII